MRVRLAAWLLIALVPMLGAVASAQQTTGTITGRVLDPQNAAIPGATVTAKSPSTGFVRTVVSDTEGVYRLSALPVGLYDLTAELSGFWHRRPQGHRRQRRPDVRRSM